MPKPPPDHDAEVAKANSLINDLVRSLARRAARRDHEEETQVTAGEVPGGPGAGELDPAIRALAELVGKMMADDVIAAAARREPEPKRSNSRRLHSLTEAAEMLAISLSTLKREIAAGNLPFILIGKRRKIDAGDLQRYIDQQRRQVELPQVTRPRALGGRSPVYGFKAARAKRKAERQKGREKR